MFFPSPGTSVTSVTGIGGAAGDVTLSMNIYSIINIEPCDTVTEVTKVPDASKNHPHGIRNGVFWKYFCHKTL